MTDLQFLAAVFLGGVALIDIGFLIIAREKRREWDQLKEDWDNWNANHH